MSPSELAGYAVQQHVKWLDNGKTNRTTLRMAIEDRCREEFCESMQWEGNPDLAGIGVLAAYFILAVFTTIFCLVYFANNIHRASKYHLIEHRDWSPTLEVFWVSSAYFALGLVFAGICVLAIEGGTEHTAVFVLLGAMIAISGLQALWPIYRPTCGHRWFAKGIIAALEVSVIIISIYVAQVRTWESDFELYCFHSLPAQHLISRILYLPIGITAFGLIIAGLKWTRKLPSGVREELLDYAIIVSGFLMMWFSLALFMHLRTQMGGLVGDSYAENEWGFGQVLAVVACLPTVAQFLAELFLKF
ncbi:hypothetical protein FDECE_18284 [Fusarium decemcellulare]|nr:hypothetical protein FDECE_18284 [Fusarium decemcellulare]